jgi:hypothetical protein
MNEDQAGLDIRHYDDVVFGLASRDPTVKPPFRVGVFDSTGSFLSDLAHRRRSWPCLVIAKGLRQTVSGDMMRHIAGGGTNGAYAIDDFAAFEAFIEG